MPHSNLLNTTDAQLKSVMNFMPSAILWVDKKQTIKCVNSTFLSIIDKKENEVAGSNLLDYPFLNLKQYFTHIELLKNRELKIVDHFEVKDEKKTIRFYIKEAPQEESFLIMGIDISNEIYRSEAHEEVRKQNEENARFMMIGQIATGVAHEINNPLAIISGFLFNMKRSLEKEDSVIDKSYFLEKISKSAINIDRIATIIRGLKFLSKNDLTSSFEKVHIQEIVNHALDLCQEKFKATGIHLTIALMTPEMIINCRPAQLTQAMIHLLTNAHDAVVECDAKLVRIEFIQTKKEFTISVIDSGPGVPMEIRSKIMQPFFTTKFANKGVGLGLSTSKVIVQDHNGELYLDEDSAETKFSIKLKV